MNTRQADSALTSLEEVPLEHRRLDAGDVNLHVVLAGPEDGPPVLLLHGFPEFWYGWRHQIPALAQAGFRVIAPDQRGYNTSDKPRAVRDYRIDLLVGDALGLLDALGHERARVVGHDWGAAVAWRMAATAPERVERLTILNVPHPQVLLCSFVTNPRQLLRSWYMFFFQLPWLPEWLLGRERAAALAGMLRGSSRRGSFSRDDVDLYRQAWSQPGAIRGMLAWYRAMIRHRPPPLPGPIQPRTMVLWGRRDAALGSELVEPSVARCREAELHWFDEATHWVQHDAAEAVNEKLVTFLER
jgi:pimeloyl-ACP methyl ester carboxylesterase